MTPLIGDGAFSNLHSNLVHSARGSDVVMTMVDGDQIVKDGHLETADLTEMISEVHEVLPGLFERRAAFLSENEDGAVSPV